MIFINKFILNIILFNIFELSKSYNLCVVGGSSSLGREIIYQSIDYDNNIIALTNNPNKIKIPYRGRGLEDNSNNNKIIYSSNLLTDKYSNYNKYNFDKIIFTLGGTAFENDYSDIITEDIINNYKNTIDQIILISANGVGDSLKNSNIGIKIMNNWYLKDVYRAKNKQEEIIKNYNKKNKNCTINIIRPIVLTYGENIYNGLSREKLAQKILDTLN